MSLQDLARPALLAAMDKAGINGAAEVSILATDDAQMADLNGAFRGRDAPTNVLSWPAETLAPATPGSVPPPPTTEELGDIALGFETCRAEADEMSRPLCNHISHLIVHGFFHLLGYDHQNDADAALMERLETETLAMLGVPNPY